jgi:competence protein ComFB
VELINRTLHCVWQTLDEVLEKRTDICKCEKCRYDMVCMALNNLRPNYFVSKHGSVYAKLGDLSQQKRTDVLTEVTRAVDRVSNNPHHLD